MCTPIARRLALLAALALSACGGNGNTTANAGTALDDNWISVWGASPYGPYPLGPLSEFTPGVALPVPSLLPNNSANDQSFRMIVQPTLGGSTQRVRLSNLMGDRPVRFEPVRIAKALLLGPAINPATDKPVTFSGASGVTIAAGAEAVSDPVKLAYGIGDNLAISFHVVGESGPITWHAVAFDLNFIGLPMAGDSTGDPTGATFAQPTVGWFFVSGVDVLDTSASGAIVALGDSITDGAYQVDNLRWTDLFAQRLHSAGIAMSVVNEGINSNTVTQAGVHKGEEWKGPAAVDRFDRDALGRSGVRSLILFEGTNDLTAGVKADAIYAGIQALVDRAHGAGLCVVLGTIMPRDDLVFGWDRSTMESDREALNMMIRSADVEGIADFDAAMGSPLDPTHPNLLYYSPDLLHPTPVGFQVMANAVPMAALVPPPIGRCTR